MRGTLNIVLSAVAAGRPPREVAMRLAVAVIIGAAAWAAMCAFMVLEPETAADRARRPLPSPMALGIGPAIQPASLRLLEPLNRPFGREGVSYA